MLAFLQPHGSNSLFSTEVLPLMPQAPAEGWCCLCDQEAPEEGWMLYEGWQWFMKPCDCCVVANMARRECQSAVWLPLCKACIRKIWRDSIKLEEFRSDADSTEFFDGEVMRQLVILAARAKDSTAYKKKSLANNPKVRPADEDYADLHVLPPAKYRKYTMICLMSVPEIPGEESIHVERRRLFMDDPPPLKHRKTAFMDAMNCSDDEL